MNVNVNTFFAIFLFWLKTLDYCIQIGYNIYDIGVWRRLVARYLGVVEAVGSNPATQTKAAGVHLYTGCFLFAPAPRNSFS